MELIGILLIFGTPLIVFTWGFSASNKYDAGNTDQSKASGNPRALTKLVENSTDNLSILEKTEIASKVIAKIDFGCFFECCEYLLYRDEVRVLIRALNSELKETYLKELVNAFPGLNEANRKLTRESHLKELIAFGERLLFKEKRLTGVVETKRLSSELRKIGPRTLEYNVPPTATELRR